MQSKHDPYFYIKNKMDLEKDTIWHEGLGMDIPVTLQMYELRKSKWTNKQKFEMGVVICEIYKRDMHTIPTITEYMGLNYRIFLTWLNTVPRLKKIYQKAKSKARKERKKRLKSKAIVGLEKLIDGYTVTVTSTKTKSVPIKRPLSEKEIEESGLNPIQDHFETEIVKSVETTVKNIFYPVNVKAIEIALFNLDKESFSKNPNSEDNIKGKVSIPVIEFIDPKLIEPEKIEPEKIDIEKEENKEDTEQ